MTTDALRRLAAQHAQTAKLLGVDFVPVYRAGSPAPRKPRPTAAPHAEPPGRSAPIPEPKPDPKPESKPAPGRAAEPAAPSGAGLFGAGPSAAPAGLKGWDFKPVPTDREGKTRALDELRARYEQDAPHQHFVTDHHSIVWGDGDPAARVMFVGEAPGAEEDRTGVPFVGRAGQLLNKMIAAMGLSRETVYIANVLKTRPPDNATPTSEEIRLCAPYLYEQIRIVSPAAIVALGLPATRALLSTTESMSRLRGNWARFEPPGSGGVSIPVMPTYHPAFLLRSYTPENRQKVWQDLQKVIDLVGSKSHLTAP